jgi:hypothetical protein
MKRLILFIALLTGGSLAQAATVTYTVQGGITYISYTTLQHNFTVGDTYTLIVVVDQNDSDGSFSVQSSNLNVDNFGAIGPVFSSLEQSNNLSDECTDPYEPCHDDYDEILFHGSANALDPNQSEIVNGYRINNYRLSLRDYDSTVLSAPDDLVLQTDFALEDFDNYFGLYVAWAQDPSLGSSGINMNMSVDSLSISVIPIPAAVWLFGSALAGLGWLKRIKKS